MKTDKTNVSILHEPGVGRWGMGKGNQRPRFCSAVPHLPAGGGQSSVEWRLPHTPGGGHSSVRTLQSTCPLPLSAERAGPRLTEVCLVCPWVPESCQDGGAQENPMGAQRGSCSSSCPDVCGGTEGRCGFFLDAKRSRAGAQASVTLSRRAWDSCFHSRTLPCPCLLTVTLPRSRPASGQHQRHVFGVTCPQAQAL